MLDRHAPGGQAGSSSRIENYLGFPTGVSGSELTRRAVTQAQRLGAEFLVPVEVCGVSVEAGYKHLRLSDGREIVTRTILAATGMAYREHTASGVSEHTGAGVYYGAAVTEAPAFKDRRVFVVGGGNSAGQGAMYLARYAKDVHIVVRRDSLKETMSQYLIEQIEKTPNIHLRALTEIERVEGDGHVRARRAEGVCRRHDRRGRGRCRFSCSSARNRCSEWLPAGVLSDAKGFVLTGRDLAGARRVHEDVEGKARALVARNERARRVRRRRHPRRGDEPRRVSRGRRLDGRALRPRISGADVDVLGRPEGRRLQLPL